MKRLFPVLALLVSGFCQAQTEQRTYIVLYDRQINADSLSAVFRARRTPADERSRITLNMLRDISRHSGAAFEKHLDQLAQEKDAAPVTYSKHWILNALVVEAPAATAAGFTTFPEVASVEDITGMWPVLMEPVKRIDDGGNRAVGAAEPGLLAVGARTLWQRGYTGKGLKLLSFDTGIWPSHPALGGRFYGEYMPMDLAWRGIFSPLPADKQNSHGTHTVGTMAGLDPATHDTIGLAFNAYFMATDPIVSNLADTIGTMNIMHKYEWVLDPDGNPNTTDDMPAVVCNSWGVNHGTSYCGSFVSTMVETIDLTGIANEYSAGNEGPGPTTVGVPAMVNPGLVNAFAVGAVNGNVATYPIASFSSRGPTSCVSGGALQIKPEVVAPGVSVRSCIKNNQYAFYDGTSMAGPHVAGVLLLLKEAFPTVAGETLKEALYYSAIDLGDPGEDNTYGRGMINAGAAYDWLVTEGYAPVPAASAVPELALEKVPENPVNYSCSATPVHKVYLYNEGAIAIADSVHFKATLNGTPVGEWTSWITLSPGARLQLNCPLTITSQEGQNELWISARQKNTPVEKDLINNNRNTRFLYYEAATVPYTERFSDSTFATAHWQVWNPDLDRTFEQFATGGQDEGTQSVAMRFFQYQTPTGQKDWLISPPVAIGTGNHKVAFDVAYQYKTVNQKDTLSLLASLDCGATFSETVFVGNAAALSTYTSPSPANFIPTAPEHWKRLTFDLPAAWNGRTVLFAFRSINAKGGNAYLDDFSVFTEIDPLTVDEQAVTKVNVYPNPFGENIRIDLDKPVTSVNLSLFDLGGRLVNTAVRKDAQHIQWNPENLPAGIYFLRVETGTGQTVHKLVKQ